MPQVIASAGAPSLVLYGLYNGNLVRSADAGATWTPLYINSAGLPQPPVLTFAVDPSNPSTLYLATTAAGGTFWKSTDSGATWATATSGLQNGGGAADYFKALLDQSTLLYLKIGANLYKSSDQGGSWQLQGNLPAAMGRMEIADSRRAWMYFVDPSTMTVWFSEDEGHSWTAASGKIPAVLQNPVIVGMSILYFNPSALYVDVDGTGEGQGPWVSTNGGASFNDASASGLGSFAHIFSYNTGALYAPTPNLMGTYRSMDSAQTWQAVGITGDHYAVTAVDPGNSSTVYGLKIPFGGTVPTSMVVSNDNGNTWNTINATIIPTIAKPAPSYNIALEQGAPYSVAFTVETVEDPTWKTPVTLSTSGEPWLRLGATSGTTPLANSLSISTLGLAPGVYTSTIRINAPQTSNQSVSIPVILTVKPVGSTGPGYLVSTIAGNGSPTGLATTGTATGVALPNAKALAFDNSGNLLISAGNWIWQYNSGNITAIAGNGTNASNGDGGPPLSASISDPDAIAVDSAGIVYFTEFAPAHVRKLAGANISTALDMSRLNQPVGSHSLLFDSANRMLLTSPAGLLRYDGLRLTVATAYNFTDPYATVMDPAGNIYISDRAQHRIFKITPSGVVTTIAGSGQPGFAGDGGPASQALLNTPEGLALDSQMTLYIADSGNNRIRAISSDGTIRTIAGSGVGGFAGDGQTGDFASFLNPSGVAVDTRGNVFVADMGNSRVRMLAPQGTATPVITKVQGPSYATKLSPGSIFSVYGDLFAAANVTMQANGAPWPVSLAGVSVSINGYLAPLYYVGKTQVNGQVPFEVTPGTATLVITTNGSAPAQITVPIVPAQPDILVQNGGTQAVAVNPPYCGAGCVNTPSTPAHAGNTVVLYLSGIGIPAPPVSTGAASPSLEPLARVNYPYTITLNSQPVSVSYFGYAPGFPALVQANFQIPAGIAPGDYNVVVTVNGASSAPAVVSVR
ncbi:MAG: SMP-30/gluconolactonase/LRE family protein [Bryobacterales bacterium]|nr:SMP-30/gluconolactonase/LRE family protein [Bryobacterales bacterium]